MRAVVLGSAAGGGFPQWNCRCENCRLAWAGDPRVKPRTQSSIAISRDGESWLLLNASPDLRQQILATPALWPREGVRHSPIAGVWLTNADIDHVAGLLTLRERQAFTLYGSTAVHAALDAPMFRVLDAAVVPRRAVEPGDSLEPLPGLAVEAFVAPGKTALYLESGEVAIGVEDGATIGLDIRADGRRLVYLPGCAAISDIVRQRIAGADVTLFDGTTFTDDEMVAQGLSTKTAHRMGHLAMSGPNGSIAGLSDVAVDRRIFIHINNTNPVLREDSAERAFVLRAGWEIAFDGMEIAL